MLKHRIIKSKISPNNSINCQKIKTERMSSSLYLLLFIILCSSFMLQSCEEAISYIPSEEEILVNVDDIIKNPEQGNDVTSTQISKAEYDKKVFIKIDTSKINSSIDFINDSNKLKYSQWTMIDINGYYTRDSSNIIIYEQNGEISSISFSYNGIEEYSRVNVSNEQMILISSSFKDFIIKIDDEILYLYNDLGSYRFKRM